MQLFVRLQTQWRLSPMGHKVGLDYQALPVVCALLDVELTEDVFTGLQIMEIALINESLKNGNG